MTGLAHFLGTCRVVILALIFLFSCLFTIIASQMVNDSHNLIETA